MNKGTRVDEILQARKLLGLAGIRVGFFLQLGYLGEELDDILATRRLVREARPDDVGVSVSYPLPGTKFYDMVKEQLGRKRHWQESNDLEMMFAGTYTSDFYRQLRNLLHDEVVHAGAPALQERWDELIDREEDFRQERALPLAGAMQLAHA
jgi:anaerobic magnesium-protoporphyrin IX monomethyl ester cyclase